MIENKSSEITPTRTRQPSFRGWHHLHLSHPNRLPAMNRPQILPPAVPEPSLQYTPIIPTVEQSYLAGAVVNSVGAGCESGGRGGEELEIVEGDAAGVAGVPAPGFLKVVGGVCVDFLKMGEVGYVEEGALGEGLVSLALVV